MKLKKAFSLIELSIVILIVGVLVAAVGQGIDLLQDARLQAARVKTQGSRVNGIKDLVLWLDATAENSFAEGEAVDNGRIQFWNDSNPQREKNNFNQSTNGQRPRYFENVINNLPAITFNGTDENMASTTFPTITSGEFTIFAVIRTGTALAPANTYDAIISKRSATTTANVNLELSQGQDGSGNKGFLAQRTQRIDLSTIAINTNYAISLTVSPPASKAFVNGKGIYNLTTGGPSINTSLLSTDLLYIGRQGLTAAPTYFDGSIGELIIYDRSLSMKERQSIEDYLGKKWGIGMTVESY
ncbi:MAG: prepilin-type N-terminal cleavage/methylation domain-containing protein [Proteobacteria bacterium]|nr:prepilin-type N-terminal cleavage/methylation domain-containing protein [Pseudomonadota bacterium]